MKHAILAALLLVPAAAAQEAPAEREWTGTLRPLLAKYCLDCHSTKDRKGDLDLERFRSLDDLRKDLRAWQHVVENLENGEMPPKKSAKPSDAERKTLVAWTRSFLDAEARARAGDPGRVLVRRLSNAQYDLTIRDLTGVDLGLARDFPADGAAGEGFTNVGDALVTSPALVTKYLAAAKEAAEHLVLLPDGFRFSAAKTRRDWTDEAVAALRREYAAYGKDGAPPLRAYLLATIRHRAAFDADAVAAREKLSPKYLRLLWAALTDAAPSYPMDLVRKSWSGAGEKDVDALVAQIAALQKTLWRHHKIGSYAGGKTARAEAVAPPVVPVQSFRVQPKVAPGDDEVLLHLSALGLPEAGPVAWRSPRVEGPKGEVLKLEDYAAWGPRFEVDLKAAFARTAAVLAELDGGPASGLPAPWVERWRSLVGDPRVLSPAAPVELLGTPVAENPKHPGLRGWRGAGELPVVLANGSAVEHRIPGRASPGKVVVHPLPDRFVAIEWAGGAAGRLRVSPRISHAHGGCGNGIAWRLELRRGELAARLDDGIADPGSTPSIAPRETELKAGDTLLLVVDPRDGSHVCDLTEADLKVEELDGARRSWTLSSDVSGTIAEGNPRGAWRFVHGPTQGASGAAKFPSESLLGRWRRDAARRAELAPKIETLLRGPRPGDTKHPDRILYDLLAHVDGPLFRDLDLKLLPRGERRFGAETPMRLRLPAALFRQHAFVVDAALDGGPERAVQFSVSTGVPALLDAKAPVVAPGAAGPALLAGLDAFRALFPPFACFPHVIPEDEVVCLKLYHREDEPLKRLFLDEAQGARLDRLWTELAHISRWPVTEHQNLPLFIGFVTQDGGAEAVKYFESLRAPFKERAAAFEKELEAAWPKHLDALLRFASLAWRRPLDAAQEASLRSLYAGLRARETAHEEAVKLVLARILTSPAFLFRVEETRPGSGAQPVDAWELASRLSYLLWASMPDEELRGLAAAGTLHEPAVLEAQAARMLRDPRSRGLATEFAAQWLHVRGIRGNREKNERLFPEFDAALRDALFEEVVLVFQDFFREGRPLSELTDADHTYVDERLAAHYGIPGVKGPAWRRVDGVRAHGRGGVFALGAVLAQHSGASRTSPVLRGNWVAEILLGDKLPKPPANVPQLPESEGGEGLSVREMTLRHTRVPECASCHVRIDPFGFALEGYDAIGRRRTKDGSGKPIDARVELRDGTTFEGADGLRTYLSARRKDVRRTFLKKLVGYALGRSVTLSDEPLLESLDRDGLTSAEAVRGIVLSPQFRRHRALDATRGE